MPIYEYDCGQGHRHELMRHIGERDAPTVCPECGQPAYRVMSRFTHKWQMKRRPERKPIETMTEYDAVA
jgi:putative FmdB family regulatory protein